MYLSARFVEWPMALNVKNEEAHRGEPAGPHLAVSGRNDWLDNIP